MENAEDRKSGKVDFHSPGRDCSDKKHFRLFGFEVDPCVCPRSESVNSSDTVSSYKVEKAFTYYSVSPKAKDKNSVSVVELKYECHLCLKKFSTLQALGGHQNAHRKERLKKKRMEVEVRRENSFNLYLSSAMRNTGVIIYPHSFIGFDDFSCIPTVVFANPLIYPHHSSTNLPYMGLGASASHRWISSKEENMLLSCPLLLKYHYPMLICKTSETPWAWVLQK